MWRGFEAQNRLKTAVMKETGGRNAKMIRNDLENEWISIHRLKKARHVLAWLLPEIGDIILAWMGTHMFVDNWIRHPGTKSVSERYRVRRHDGEVSPERSTELWMLEPVIQHAKTVRRTMRLAHAPSQTGGKLCRSRRSYAAEPRRPEVSVWTRILW